MNNKLPQAIEVIDVTMRDGLQNEERYVPLEGKLYLACNPVSGDWADRTPLVILRSDNGGKTFSPFVTLEDQLMDPRIPEIREGRRTTAEFSYPAIVAKSGKLHVTYTYLRRQIVYREITP